MKKLIEVLKLKRNILIAAFSVVTGILLAISLTRKSSAPETPETKPTLQLPTPKISTLIEEGIPISSNITEETYASLVPRELTVYSIDQTTFASNKIQEIARSFNFENSPQVVTDSFSGTIYSWRSDTQSLRIAPNLLSVTYKTGFLPTSDNQSKLSQQQLVEIAKKILTEKRLVEVNDIELVSVLPLSVDISEFDYNIERKESNIVEIKFVEKLNNYHIVNSSADLGTINIKLDYSGNVNSIFVDRIPTVNPIRSYKTKSFNAFRNTLSQSTIMSLDEGRINPLDAHPQDFKTVLISKIEIVYLQELSPSQIFLQPIFFLKGNAQFLDDKTVTVILYLPALAP